MYRKFTSANTDVSPGIATYYTLALQVSSLISEFLTSGPNIRVVIIKGS